MGKNQSKEQKYKINESTPEPDKGKGKQNIQSATRTPETKRQSTLLALKDIATPPGLRKTESTKSRIRWPSSSKKNPAGTTPSSQAPSKLPIDRAESKVKHTTSTTELKPAATIPSFSANTSRSPERHVEIRETIAQLERMHITPAVNYTPETRTSPAHSPRALPSTISQAIPSPSQKATTMSHSRKENMPLSSTAHIRSDSMDKSGDLVKPTKSIFEATHKRRKVLEEPTQDASALPSTSEPLHNDATSEKQANNTIFDFPPRSTLDKNAQFMAPGCQTKTLADKTVNAASPGSRKRKSEAYEAAVEVTEVLKTIPNRNTMRPEDFEKLARYGMFQPGALCSIRKGVPIPYQILEHIKIYYEEGLSESLRYFLEHGLSCPFLNPPFVSRKKPTQGVVKHATKLLNCICTSGQGDDSEEAPPAFIPPPSYIALLTTMLIHPTYTTDAPSGSEARNNMSAAFDTLENILDAVGSKAANMKEVFQFSKSATSGGRASRTKKTKRHLEEDAQTNPDDEQTGINHPLAQGESVWNTATDLWHVVGWAFNCSVTHRDRWEYYRLWLKIVCFAIEDDFYECVDDNESKDFDPVSQSILGRTIIGPNIASLSRRVDTKPGLKRAVAACFAHGEGQSLKMFPEVWKDELNPAARVEVAGDKFEKALADAGKPLPNDVYEHAGLREGTVWFGGTKALELRCKFLIYLLDFDYNLFGRKQASRDIYGIICDSLTNLPFDMFTAFLDKFTKLGRLRSVTSLYQVCANRLIDTKAPHNPNRDDSYDLPIMTKCYLPFAANTSSPEDNAKLAYCIDFMLRLVAEVGGIPDGEPDFSQRYGCTVAEVNKVIELGTYTRLKKCEKVQPKAKNEEDREALFWEYDYMRDHIRISGGKMHAALEKYYGLIEETVGIDGRWKRLASPEHS